MDTRLHQAKRLDAEVESKLVQRLDYIGKRQRGMMLWEAW